VKWEDSSSSARGRLPHDLLVKKEGRGKSRNTEKNSAHLEGGISHVEGGKGQSLVEWRQEEGVTLKTREFSS